MKSALYYFEGYFVGRTFGGSPGIAFEPTQPSCTQCTRSCETHNNRWRFSVPCCTPVSPTSEHSFLRAIGLAAFTEPPPTPPLPLSPRSSRAGPGRVGRGRISITMGSGRVAVARRFIPLVWVAAFSVLAILDSAGRAMAQAQMDSAMVRSRTIFEGCRSGGKGEPWHWGLISSACLVCSVDFVFIPSCLCVECGGKQLFILQRLPSSLFYLRIRTGTAGNLIKQTTSCYVKSCLVPWYEVRSFVVSLRCLPAQVAFSLKAM